MGESKSYRWWFMLLSVALGPSVVSPLCTWSLGEGGKDGSCARGNALLHVNISPGLTTAEGALGQAGHTVSVWKAHSIFSCDVFASGPSSPPNCEPHRVRGTPGIFVLPNLALGLVHTRHSSVKDMWISSREEIKTQSGHWSKWPSLKKFYKQ